MGSVRSSTKYLCWQITLHTAAVAESTSNRVTVSCNCKAVCTGHCRCKKNQVQCSVYCHADEYDCGNLSPLTNYIGKLNPGSRASWVSCQTECKRVRLSARGLSARKRTNTIVQGQNTARVTRGRHVQGQEEEYIERFARSDTSNFVERNSIVNLVHQLTTLPVG
jgi:hypothetical protein